METKRKMLETNACKCKAAKSKKRFLLTKFVQIPNENGKCLCMWCRRRQLLVFSICFSIFAVNCCFWLLALPQRILIISTQFLQKLYFHENQINAKQLKMDCCSCGFGCWQLRIFNAFAADTFVNKNFTHKSVSCGFGCWQLRLFNAWWLHFLWIRILLISFNKTFAWHCVTYKIWIEQKSKGKIIRLKSRGLATLTR